MTLFPMTILPMFPLEDWDTSHADPTDWVALFGMLGLVLFVGALLFAIVRALLNRHRYRAMNVLSDADRGELAGQIQQAESRTSGEIAVVVLERSDAHPGALWLAAGSTAVLGTALLAGWLPWGHPLGLLGCQLAMGAFGFLCASTLPGFRRVFISSTRATEMATEQAIQEFYAHDLHRTEAQTGVLIFVSLLEHRVTVLGDKGISDKLDASHWTKVDEAVIEGIRSRSMKDGLSRGIGLCADVLAEHFPGSHDDQNEVPNHVIVRAE
tara:strand:+ start:1479 stop:2282 length:804 start_codon:yes stop_codon:yes gene_type:complete